MTDFLSDVESCLDVLKSGGIILYPTDTVWGLGCDATNPKAVEKIYLLKQRSAGKNMNVLLADERDILKYTVQPDLRVFEYLKKVQKPTTIIYQGAIGLADNLIQTDGTIGIRVVNEPFCKHLIKRFRKPVVSTSANLSGQPAPGMFNEIAAVIKDGADYIVQYRQDDNTVAAPSSVIKWNADGSITTIR
ncbi:MAG: L-threonylcarbamoyladenylate synthase [Chitinophagaceae bacterium]